MHYKVAKLKSGRVATVARHSTRKSARPRTEASSMPWWRRIFRRRKSRNRRRYSSRHTRFQTWEQTQSLSLPAYSFPSSNSSSTSESSSSTTGSSLSSSALEQPSQTKQTSPVRSTRRRRHHSARRHATPASHRTSPNWRLASIPAPSFDIPRSAPSPPPLLPPLPDNIPQKNLKPRAKRNYDRVLVWQYRNQHGDTTEKATDALVKQGVIDPPPPPADANTGIDWTASHNVRAEASSAENLRRGRGRIDYRHRRRGRMPARPAKQGYRKPRDDDLPGKTETVSVSPAPLAPESMSSPNRQKPLPYSSAPKHLANPSRSGSRSKHNIMPDVISTSVSNHPLTKPTSREAHKQLPTRSSTKPPSTSSGQHHDYKSPSRSSRTNPVPHDSTRQHDTVASQAQDPPPTTSQQPIPTSTSGVVLLPGTQPSSRGLSAIQQPGAEAQPNTAPTQAAVKVSNANAKLAPDASALLAVLPAHQPTKQAASVMQLSIDDTTLASAQTQADTPRANMVPDIRTTLVNDLTRSAVPGTINGTRRDPQEGKPAASSSQKPGGPPRLTDDLTRSVIPGAPGNPTNAAKPAAVPGLAPRRPAHDLTRSAAPGDRLTMLLNKPWRAGIDWSHRHGQAGLAIIGEPDYIRGHNLWKFHRTGNWGSLGRWTTKIGTMMFGPQILAQRHKPSSFDQPDVLAPRRGHYRSSRRYSSTTSDLGTDYSTDQDSLWDTIYDRDVPARGRTTSPIPGDLRELVQRDPSPSPRGRRRQGQGFGPTLSHTMPRRRHSSPELGLEGRRSRAPIFTVSMSRLLPRRLEDKLDLCGEAARARPPVEIESEEEAVQIARGMRRLEKRAVLLGRGALRRGGSMLRRRRSGRYDQEMPKPSSQDSSMNEETDHSEDNTEDDDVEIMGHNDHVYDV
ncbi:uncharacterized protein JN550_002758 [Neoarthrinium moseri]|uniref:uncharacterized protein n=1 Tax=Neoarthrinium moseri TaxID=1658444 RepID=UPI001FDCD8DC|nr:uncharacterized protein JN550_002758 [Neoarthrinium moseri]KAI1874179.1 hypothetical protein JN550_002758 [Neoarthrinium moseri]